MGFWKGHGSHTNRTIGIFFSINLFKCTNTLKQQVSSDIYARNTMTCSDEWMCSDMFKTPGDCFQYGSVSEKQWEKFVCHCGVVLGAGAGTLILFHHTAARSKRLFGGNRFVTARLFIALFEALIEDILSTIALGVESCSKFSYIYMGSYHPSISQLLEPSNHEQLHLLATRSFFMSC